MSEKSKVKGMGADTRQNENIIGISRHYGLLLSPLLFGI